MHYDPMRMDARYQAFKKSLSSQPNASRPHLLYIFSSDSQKMMGCTCAFLVCILAAIVLIISLAILLVSKWRIFRYGPLIWRNKYPSFEEVHALFDRGDIMLSTVLIASTLQLSHPKLARTLRAHSTYTTDPWRRVIRTTAFIYIMIRASSSEREAVVRWLRRLHKPIPLFVFETNVLVFATFAYGLVKTHQMLGEMTTQQVDAMVKGVMSMANRLDPMDKGRRVPSTIDEIEEYLHRELSFDVEELMRIHRGTAKICSLRKEVRKQGANQFLKRPIAFLKLVLMKWFIFSLSTKVLAQRYLDPSKTSTNDKYTISPLAILFWWSIRKAHCFLSYFHYSTCPQTLTFDGSLNLLVSGNPRTATIPSELYQEIFATTGDSSTHSTKQPEERPTLRRFKSDMEAHLPNMQIDERPMLPVPSFPTSLLEHLKCSYLRAQLSTLTTQHNTNHPISQHLGVIMDGNRRYSRTRHLSSILSGHQVGAHKLLQVLSWTFSANIRTLTVWA